MNPDLLIPETASIRDAMQAMDVGHIALAFVTGPDGVLLGVVSDGDIRRALLKGRGLEDPVADCMARDVRTVPPDVSRNDVLDLMQACWLEQIPIVDERHRLVGVHLLHEILGRVQRPNWAVVFAGGKGTRLAPLTENTPKPMLAVAGRPILERIVHHIVSFGIQRLFLCINFLGDQVKDHFGDGARFGCRIEYLEESPDDPLGTGGGLSLLPERPTHSTLVMNGDLVTQVEVGRMLEFHDRHDNYATIGIRRYIHRIPFGCVTVRDGRVVELEEKPQLCRSISAGVYVLSPEAVAEVPRRFFPITELFSTGLSGGKPVGGFMIEDEWTHVGYVDELEKANGIET